MLQNNQNNINVVPGVCITKQIEYVIICPNCYKNDLKVRAIRKKKTRYYYCKSCKKTTSEPIQLGKNEEKVRAICGRCEGKKLVRKGLTSNKKQKYYCSECNKYSVSPKLIREKIKEVEELFCSNCQKNNLKKKGFNKVGKQVYYCGSCKRRTVKIYKEINYVLALLSL